MKKTFLPYLKPTTLYLAIAFCTCCTNHPTGEDTARQKEAAQIAIDSCRSAEGLQAALQKFKDEKNPYGQMLALKKLGKTYRNQANFGEAIRVSEEAYRIAEQLKDTSAMIQNLNDLGTNFRRMGVLQEASDYHYRALTLAEKVEDTTYTSQKNKVVALNGLGNVLLTLENYTAAEAAFKRAMAGEKKLGSELGQAINAANIGAIFDKQGQYDSAYCYYRQSLRHNQAARSDLGIALCYGYFGSLNEKQGKYKEARKDYEQAYDIMQKSSDSWHWLESCIALARINFIEGHTAKALEYLQQAKDTAQKIHAKEHLAEIHELYYKIYDKQGQYDQALSHFVKGHAYSDSVKNEKNVMSINNLRVNYEREKGQREVNAATASLKAEQRQKRMILTSGIALVFSLAAIVGIMFYLLRIRIRVQEAMRKVESMRSSFFTNVTHEFRTPLTVILGMAEHLRETSLTEKEQAESIGTLEKQGKVLLGLVNQLLDMSKVMSKDYTPQWYRGDVVIFLRMATEPYRQFASQHDVRIVLRSKESETDMDFVPVYWEKILRNLVSNALKYTPHGGEIRIGISTQGKDIVWSVADTGTGIAREDLPHLFDEFYRGTDSGKHTGNGIGLAFVRQMVTAMGGSIGAANAPEGGAVFTIRLPRYQKGIGTLPYQGQPSAPTETAASLVGDEDTAATHPLPTDTNTDETRGKPIVLIVEDNEDISSYLATILKNDYRLAFATDGQEGLEKATAIIPDLIVTDLMMPQMDGYEMAGKIRSAELTNHIPIVVITARCEAADRLKGWEKGVDVYLTKPFKAEELLLCVHKLLQQRELLRQKYSKALRGEDDKEVKFQPIDKQFLDKLNLLISEHMAEHALSSETLADKLCISRSQLNRKVKSITGYNTAAYILLHRMDYARRLLSSTQLPIGEIADQCGFEDQSHFARNFKQIYNVTPTAYRKTNS